MAAVGAPRSFENKFAFTVEVDGVTHAGFNKCSEISAEFDKVEHREGGSLIPNKSPGLLNWADVTLERGAVIADSDLYDWFEETGDSAQGVAINAGEASGLGLNDNDYKRNFDVVKRDRNGAELGRVRVFGAWITKYVFGEWDNDTSEKTIEMVTLAIDYAKRIS